MTRPPATEAVPCNLCGAGDYEVVAEKDRDGRGLQTVLCRRCGLVWTNPRPSAVDLDRYYQAEYRADYSGVSTPARRKILRGMLGARERMHALRPLLRPGVRLFDVGCGAGELVYLLRRHGIDAAGLEPGSEYAEFARRVLEVPVQTATVDTAVVAACSQDVVTMFHCLEHVADPKAVLRTVRDWVVPGGSVVVEVPNVAATVQAPSHRFHFAHLYHFTGATLAALGDAAGLRTTATTYSADGGNVIGLFRRESDEVRQTHATADAAMTREILSGHTAWRHYLSFTPYGRALARLRRRRDEDRLLRRLPTIEAIVRWAAGDLRL